MIGGALAVRGLIFLAHPTVSGVEVNCYLAPDQGSRCRRRRERVVAVVAGTSTFSTMVRVVPHAPTDAPTASRIAAKAMYCCTLALSAIDAD